VRHMQQLHSRSEVAEASGADPQCMWAAQSLLTGGCAWASEGAVVVGGPGLCGRDRLIVRGPAGPAVDLVRAVIDSLGPSYLIIGDPPLMTVLLARISTLEPRGFFGWMDCIRRPLCRPVHQARWLSRQEWRAADQLLIRPSGPTSVAKAQDRRACLARASNFRLASTIFAWLSRAQWPNASTGSSSDRPSFVNSYSTRGGMVGNTVRVTSPSRSNAHNVSVSMRCEMLAIDRRSSLKRVGPSPSMTTTSTLHLSPTRSSTSLTARHTSGTRRLLGNTAVRSCAFLTGIYLASV